MRTQNSLHILFEISFEEYPEQLEQVEAWKKIGKNSLEKGRFTVLKETIHKFEPQGTSAFWLLSESHLSFHSWPEEKIIFGDLFSCGDRQQTSDTFDELKKYFGKYGGVVASEKWQERGFVYEK